MDKKETVKVLNKIYKHLLNWCFENFSDKFEEDAVFIRELAKEIKKEEGKENEKRRSRVKKENQRKNRRVIKN